MPRVNIFSNFTDFWKHTFHLKKHQRDKLFNSLNSHQKKILNSSYEKEFWEDLFSRNKVDKIIDEIRSQINIDLFDVQRKISNNKSVYLSSEDWSKIKNKFNKNVKGAKYYDFIIGNIRSIEINDETVLLVSNQK